MLSENRTAHVAVLSVQRVGFSGDGEFPIFCYPIFVLATAKNSLHQVNIMPTIIILLGNAL